MNCSFGVDEVCCGHPLQLEWREEEVAPMGEGEHPHQVKNEKMKRKGQWKKV